MVVASVAAAWLIITFLPGHRNFAGAAEANAAGSTRLQVNVSDAGVTLNRGLDSRVHVSAHGTYSSTKPSISATSANSITTVNASCPGSASHAIGSFHQRCQLDVVITVPVNLAVQLADDNGPITASNLSGALQLRSVNGAVTVSNSSGPLTLHSENGEIDVNRARSGRVAATSENGSINATFATAPTSVTATTQNGAIDIAVPTDSPYAVHAIGGTGSSKIDIPRSATANRKISASTQNGDIYVHPLDG